MSLRSGCLPLVAAAALALPAASPAAEHPRTRAVIGGPLLATPGTIAAAGTAPLPPTTAQAFLVADLDSGAVLAARAAHRRLRPASTLKLLTSLALLPRLDPRAWYVAQPGDVTMIGSRVGLVTGVRYRVSELFYGLLLSSGNDAAHALATSAGGVPRTVARMNAEAARLGALDTHAVTPEGLDEDGQLTSAYDLALIGRAVFARADFRRYSGTRTYAFPGVPRYRKYEIQNENRLLGKAGVFVGKNGYTTLAGNTYVGAAAVGGRRVLVVLMHPVHGRIYDDAAALLSWGFAAERARATPVGQLVAPGEVGQVAAPPPAATDRVVGSSTATTAAGLVPALETPLREAPGWILGGLALVVATLAAIGHAFRGARRRAAPARDQDPGLASGVGPAAGAVPAPGPLPPNS